jgi:hypothetical protein
MIRQNPIGGAGTAVSSRVCVASVYGPAAHVYAPCCREGSKRNSSRYNGVWTVISLNLDTQWDGEGK